MIANCSKVAISCTLCNRYTLCIDFIRCCPFELQFSKVLKIIEMLHCWIYCWLVKEIRNAYSSSAIRFISIYLYACCRRDCASRWSWELVRLLDQNSASQQASCLEMELKNAMYLKYGWSFSYICAAASRGINCGHTFPKVERHLLTS